MKLITGVLRGRPIPEAAHAGLRPTSDKVRKAIFDILSEAVVGKRVLDLCSGTGALGLEALSSGAAQVTFVEMNKGQAAKIRKNLKHFQLESRSRVICADVSDALQLLADEGGGCDIILLDPPYETGLGERVLKILAHSSLLTAGTLLVYECAKREPMPSQTGRFALIKEKIYGDTRLIIYRA